jgi:hypothetical protein
MPILGVMVTVWRINMRVSVKNIALAALAMALAACAGGSDRYPSLSLRPFETTPVADAPAPAPPIRPVTDAGLINALRDRAANAHAAFVSAAPAATTLARNVAGRSAESDAGAAALVALADLRSKRSSTAAVLAEIDLLTAEADVALSPDPMLASVQAEVASLVASEDAVLAQLAQVIGA